jgi:hypothetical protein
MTHRNIKTHPAMTAIAAVIALSSAPLLAQSIEAPNLTTPAPATDTTAPVTADPIAPAPVVDTSAADPLAPEVAAKPAARKAATAKSTAAPPRPAAARAASAAPAVAAVPAATSVPVNAAPVEPPLPAEPEAVPVSAPAADPPAPADTNMIDPMIPVAGIGALGLLALAGTGLRSRAAGAAPKRLTMQRDGSLSERTLTLTPTRSAMVEPELQPASGQPKRPFRPSHWSPSSRPRPTRHRLWP